MALIEAVELRIRGKPRPSTMRSRGWRRLCSFEFSPLMNSSMRWRNREHRCGPDIRAWLQTNHAPLRRPRGAWPIALPSSRRV